MAKNPDEHRPGLRIWAVMALGDVFVVSRPTSWKMGDSGGGEGS